MKWKPLRVVVEIRVPPKSPITQKILERAIKECIAYNDLPMPVGWTSHYSGPYTQPKVKSYSHIQGYETKQLRKRMEGLS